MSNDDKTWHPPVGKLFVRELRGEVDYGFIVSDPDGWNADVVKIATFGRYEEPTWEFRTSRWVDGAKGRECKTGGGDIIRRRLATDEDVARLRAGLPDGFDLAAWRVRLLRDVPVLDRADLDRLTASDAVQGHQ